MERDGLDPLRAPDPSGIGSLRDRAIGIIAFAAVLALYIASGAAEGLYSRHQLMWLVCPLLLYWVGYLWLNAHRGKMHHDPLVFTLHDGRSRGLLLLMLATAALAL